MEAPRGALRHYNADELEPLSRAGLEALLMEIQDEYHLREKAPKKVSTAGSRRDDVGSATVLKRPKEYPDESLTAQGNELYCNCCGTAVASDSTGLKRHLKSDTHQKKIKVWVAKHETKAQTAALLKGYKAQEQTRLGAAAVSSPALVASVVVVGVRGMETVSSDVKVRRFEILEALLEAGVCRVESQQAKAYKELVPPGARVQYPERLH